MTKTTRTPMPHNVNAKRCKCSVCTLARKTARDGRRNQYKKKMRTLEKEAKNDTASDTVRRADRPVHASPQAPPHSRNETPAAPATHPRSPAPPPCGRVYTNNRNAEVMDDLLEYLAKRGVKTIVDLNYGEGNFYSPSSSRKFTVHAYDKYKCGDSVRSYDELAADVRKSSIAPQLVVLDPPYRATGGGYTCFNSRTNHAQTTQSAFGAEHHLHPDNVLGFYEAELEVAAQFKPQFLIVKVQDQARVCLTAFVVERAKAHGFGYWFKAILVNKSVQQTKGQLPSNSSDFLVFERRKEQKSTADLDTLSIERASDSAFQQTAQRAERKTESVARVAATAIAKHLELTKLSVSAFVEKNAPLYEQDHFTLTEKAVEHAKANTDARTELVRQPTILQFFRSSEKKPNQIVETENV